MTHADGKVILHPGTLVMTVLAVILYGLLLLHSAQAQVTMDTYNLTLAVGETGQVRLPVNPSTGCSWWVESAPSGVDISTSSSIDPTIDCGNPPRLGCSNEVVVYSFKSATAGQYTVELRYGHAWARNEYYQVATVQLTVVDHWPSQEALSGRVAKVESTCAPMSCRSEPLSNETNRACPAMCMLSYRVELVVHLGPTGSLAQDRLYQIYITGGSGGQMRAANLKVGDEVSILAHPAGYCACGPAECDGGDCWLANDSDWQYGLQTLTYSATSSGSVTSTTAPFQVGPRIPGFSWESMMAGLLLGVAVILRIRRHTDSARA